MARRFTPTTDEITCSPGAIASVDGGPATVVALWQPGSVHTGQVLVAANAGGYETFGMLAVNDGHLYATVGGSFSELGTYTAAWRIDAWTKAAGSAAVRHHATVWGSGSWSHTDHAAMGDTSTVPITTVHIGLGLGGIYPYDGDLAALAVSDQVWSDGDIETLTGGLAAWLALCQGTNAALWAFGQATVAEPLTDVTGGGADQVTISGTSVVADPPDWSYALIESAEATLTGTLPAPSLSVAGTAVPPSPVSGGLSATLPSLGLAAVGEADSPSLRPTTELVARAWLRTASGFSAAMVDTRLPRDASSWADSGFVTVGNGLAPPAGAVVGGSIQPHCYVREPVVSIHAWAVHPSSGRPPWNRANYLAELVAAACEDKDSMQRLLTLPAGYHSARVLSAHCPEPRRMPGDEGAYAHYQIDLVMHWVPL
jgi:hypothetical protein